MKCPNCNGVPYDEVWTCEMCNGKGIIEPLTNEEWLSTLNTEQKAEFLFKMAGHCSMCGDESQDTWKKVMSCPFGKTVCVKNDWEVWLKQPHTNS